MLRMVNSSDWTGFDQVVSGQLSETESYRVAAESGDLLVREGRVPSDVRVGDLLATPVTGAYGYSLGSNYNKVPRPAVVFVKDGEAREVIRRETWDDLLRLDA